MEHVDVYRKKGRYCGWPANYGIWSWDDEIVVGFTVGYHLKEDGEYVETDGHARDARKPQVPMQARSRDGGRTWRVRGTPCRTPGDRNLSADEHIDADLFEELHVGGALDSVNAPVEHPGGIDFDHPDFALMCARTGIGKRFDARSWFYVSYARCERWNGPYWLPTFGHDHVAARTDYVVENDSTCSLFVPVMDGPPLVHNDDASTSDILESAVVCVRTTDWGGSFEKVGTVIEGAIMPASIRRADGRLLSAVRRTERIDLFESSDSGRTWSLLATPASDTGGNPPTLTELRDGTLCVTYGYRGEDDPGIRATLSDDGGTTWSDPIVLRGGAGTPDIGYPRTVQRSDGRVVTVYYFHDASGSERYIGATIWDPSEVA